MAHTRVCVAQGFQEGDEEVSGRADAPYSTKSRSHYVVRITLAQSQHQGGEDVGPSAGGPEVADGRGRGIAHVPISVAKGDQKSVDDTVMGSYGGAQPTEGLGRNTAHVVSLVIRQPFTQQGNQMLAVR